MLNFSKSILMKKLIYILDSLRVRKFSSNLNFWVNFSFKSIYFAILTMHNYMANCILLLAFALYNLHNRPVERLCLEYLIHYLFISITIAGVLRQPHDSLVHNTKSSHHHIPTDEEWHAHTHAVDSLCTGQLWYGFLQCMQPSRCKTSFLHAQHCLLWYRCILYVYYSNACYLTVLAHTAVFVTACGRDDDASNISKHLLQLVNISLCDRREYRITCVTAGRVALETMRAMMSRRHHIVTARSSIQLWPAFQPQVQDTHPQILFSCAK